MPDSLVTAEEKERHQERCHDAKSDNDVRSSFKGKTTRSESCLHGSAGATKDDDQHNDQRFKGSEIEIHAPIVRIENR
jgi:hypothetical protein